MKKKKEFKKKLEAFVKDESGSISKDTVLKVSLGTISALGIMSSFASGAANAQPSHENSVDKLAQTCVHSSY